MKTHNPIRYILVLVLLTFSGILNATNYYADWNSGNDLTGNGSSGNPVKSITKGMTLMSSGDVLLIKPGVYEEKVWIQKSGITLRAFDPDNRPVIRPTVAQQSGTTVQVMSIFGYDDLVIDGLILDGINLVNRVVDVGGDNITFQNCEVINGYQSGFLTSGGSATNLNFINLDVYGNGRENEGSHGFYLVCENSLIENCRVHDNGGYGIKLGTNTATNDRTTNYVTVRNNLVYKNPGKSGIGVNHTANGVVIYNNVCYGNSDAGIDISYNTSNVKVFNNTCFGNSSGVAMVEVVGPAGEDDGVDHAEIANNILFGNDIYGNVYISFPDTVNPGDTSDISMHHNFFTNPKFVDRHAGDFRLLLTSTALTGAADIAGVTTDLLGDPRTSGSYSYGAYEEGVDESYRYEYYVDSLTGNDSNDGTFSFPYKTINKGMLVLIEGDVLYVMNGTYNEHISTFLHGTASSPITIRAYPNHHPVLKPVNMAAYRGLVDFIYYPSNGNVNVAAYLVFDGFKLDVMNQSGYGMLFEKSHHITVKNCEVTNGPTGIQAIYAHTTYPSHHIEFDNCDVHDNRSIGFYLTTEYNTIKNCRVYNNITGGIYYAGPYATVTGNTVYSNTFTGIGIGPNSIAYNNVSRNNGTGMGVSGAGSKVYNNTLYSNSTGLSLNSNSSGVQVKNNISYSSSTNIENFGSGNTLANNYTSNPLFVNAAAYDFHLQEASPIIDKGATLSEVLTDFDGNTRPQRQKYDIGAFENTSLSHLYYVDSLTGNDTNSGTWAFPYKTINKGLTVIGAGDILYVKNGTYIEFINTWKQGTASAPIIIKAYPGHSPVIKPTATSIANQFMVGFRQSSPTMACYIEFDGFILDADNSALWGILFEYAHHVTVRNCEIKNTADTWPGIHSRLSAEYNTLEDLHIHHNGNVGVYFNSNNNTVAGSHIHDNKMGGIVAWAGASITGNWVHHNERNGIQTGAGCMMYNNVVHNQPWNGVQVSGANCNVYNNTLVSNDRGIYLDANGSTCNVKNNIVTPNASNTITNSGSGNTVSDNFTTGSADFVDAANYDYHLNSTSTAIDYGVNLSAVFTIDHDSVTRDTAFDAGAYEYVDPFAKTGRTTATTEETTKIVQLEDGGVSSVAVYPNPVRERFTVSKNAAEGTLRVEVYNMVGQLMANGEISASEQELMISTEWWSKGIYIVKVHSGSGTDTIRVLKGE